MTKDLNNRAEEAWQHLMEGNQRYVTGNLEHPHQSPQRREKVSSRQHPIAVVLICSDSRVSPQTIFDQGLGDLFVVRVAGNILDDVVIASIEYAVELLHVPLVAVVGHSQCGAIRAAVAGEATAGHLPSIAAELQPAIDRVKDAGDNVIDEVAKANATLVAERLRTTGPVLDHLAKEGKFLTVAAFYDLKTGIVERL